MCILSVFKIHMNLTLIKLTKTVKTIKISLEVKKWFWQD